MGSFNYQELFGSNVEIETQNGFISKVMIVTDSIRDTDNYGTLPVGIGLNNGNNPTATQVLYGILMFLKRSQATNINDDPTQKVYIVDSGKTLATGARDGQIKRTFSVSFFINAGLAGIPSVGQIDT